MFAEGTSQDLKSHPSRNCYQRYFVRGQVRGAPSELSSRNEQNCSTSWIRSPASSFDSHWVTPALVIFRWSLQVRSPSVMKLTHRFPEDVQLVHYFRFIPSFLSIQRPQGMEVWASFSKPPPPPPPAHLDFQFTFT